MMKTEWRFESVGKTWAIVQMDGQRVLLTLEEYRRLVELSMPVGIATDTDRATLRWEYDGQGIPCSR